MLLQFGHLPKFHITHCSIDITIFEGLLNIRKAVLELHAISSLKNFRLGNLLLIGFYKCLRTNGLLKNNDFLLQQLNSVLQHLHGSSTRVEAVVMFCWEASNRVEKLLRIYSIQMRQSPIFPRAMTRFNIITQLTFSFKLDDLRLGLCNHLQIVG